MKEKEINIAEILKDCPKGAPLYSTPFGVVYFETLVDNTHIVTIDDNGRTWSFHNDGSYMMNASECVLFPSKDQRDWSKFEMPVLPPFNIRRVEMHNLYYYIKIDGTVAVNNDVHLFDNQFEFGNYFNTREQAEYAAEKVKELLLSLRKEEEK